MNIVKYSELVHIAETHSQARASSFRIFYDIHSITYKYIWPHLDYTSHCIDYPVESCKITVIHFGFMLPNL